VDGYYEWMAITSGWQFRWEHARNPNIQNTKSSPDRFASSPERPWHQASQNTEMPDRPLEMYVCSHSRIGRLLGARWLPEWLPGWNLSKMMSRRLDFSEILAARLERQMKYLLRAVGLRTVLTLHFRGLGPSVIPIARGTN